MKVNWNIRSHEDSRKEGNKDSIVLFYTNAAGKIRIDLDHSKVMGQTNFLITVLPNEADHLAVSEYVNKISQRRIRITADDKKRFYGLVVDKYGNFIDNVSCTWSLENLTGSLSALTNTSVDFSPDKAGEGRIKASYVIGSGEKKKEVRSDIVVQVLPGKMEKIAVSHNNKYLSSDESFYSGRDISLFSYAIDSKNNVIGKISPQWTVSYDQTNTITADNTNALSLRFENKVDDGLLVVSDKSHRTEIRFDVLFGDLVKLGLMKKKEEEFVESITLHQKESLTLKAVGVDKNGDYVKDMESYWVIPGRDDILQMKYGMTNVVIGVGDKFSGRLILTNSSLEPFVGRINVLPPEIVIRHDVKEFDSKNIILYCVYNGDNLSRILEKQLKIHYKWHKAYKYIRAIGDYNKIRNIDLIFPKQIINIPYYKVDREMTRRELSMELFNDQTMEKHVLIYNKKGDIITPEDKVVIMNVDFLRTGRMKVDVIKEEIKE